MDIAAVSMRQELPRDSPIDRSREQMGLMANPLNIPPLRGGRRGRRASKNGIHPRRTWSGGRS